MAKYNVTLTRPLDETYRPLRGQTLLRGVSLEVAYSEVAGMYWWATRPALLPEGSIVRITLQHKATKRDPRGSCLYREWLIKDKEWLQSYKNNKRLLPLPRERKEVTNGRSNGLAESSRK